LASGRFLKNTREVAEDYLIWGGLKLNPYCIYRSTSALSRKFVSMEVYGSGNFTTAQTATVSINLMAFVETSVDNEE